jgi:polyphosphate kinase
MPRNLYRRVEVVFPVEDGNLRERFASELLAIPLQDNTKARLLQADGTWRRARPKRGEKPHRSQAEFLARASQTSQAGQGRAKSRYPKVKLAPRPKALASGN